MMSEDAALESTAGRPAVALVSVDLDVPHLDHPFEYEIPAALLDQVGVGSLVEVRFAGRKRRGWVLGIVSESSSGKKLAPLLRCVAPVPLVSEGLLESANYLARRYAANLPQILAFTVPARRASEEAKAGKNYNQVAGVRQTPTDEAPATPVRRAVDTLYPGQFPTAIVKAVEMQTRHSCGTVVVSPTSSQVDEIIQALKRSNPELRIGNASATRSPAARYRVHLQAIGGQLDVVVGTRSAVWTPLKDLGGIVIWDDGDDRLREQRAPRFDALDVAVARSHVEQIDLLSIGYARSVKSQALLESGWATDNSPMRRDNLRLIPQLRVFDAFEMEREGITGRSRIPDAAYKLIREGVAKGPVLVQVAAAGYRTLLPCPDCGAQPGGKVDGCGHPSHDAEQRMRIGSDRIREELQRAFPEVPVIASSSTAGLIRSIGDEPQIVVATTSAEPLVPGGYKAAVITETESIAYLDEIWAPLEAARRWFNALALCAPGAPAILIGSLDETLEQALVQWRPSSLAARELEERRELGFPPTRWVVSVSGDGAAIEQVVASVISETVILGIYDSDEESKSVVISVPPSHVFPLMDRLREIQIGRSRAKESLLVIESNPLRLIPA